MPTNRSHQYEGKTNPEDSLAEETLECRKNGYVLTGKFLGKGAYARVYLGQPLSEKVKSNPKLRRMAGANNNMKVAIKVISSKSAPKIYITKFLPREVATMNRCYRHPNVVQLYEIFATKRRIYLVLEYAENGDLLNYINRCYSKKNVPHNILSEDRARQLFIDMLLGLQFIHSQGVAHRDLKCENILLGPGNRAKLSDFGFAIEPKHNMELLQTHCGSYAYASPEILRRHKYNGKLADIWSLGVILFAMVNGGLPFKETSAKAVLAAMKETVYFKSYLTAECKDLIRCLLKTKPHKRLSIPEIFEHPWVIKSPALPHHTQLPATQIVTGEYKNFRSDFDHPDLVYKYLQSVMDLEPEYFKKSSHSTALSSHKKEVLTITSPFSTKTEPPRPAPMTNVVRAKEPLPLHKRNRQKNATSIRIIQHRPKPMVAGHEVMVKVNPFDQDKGRSLPNVNEKKENPFKGSLVKSDQTGERSKSPQRVSAPSIDYRHYKTFRQFSPSSSTLRQPPQVKQVSDVSQNQDHRFTAAVGPRVIVSSKQIKSAGHLPQQTRKKKGHLRNGAISAPPKNPKASKSLSAVKTLTVPQQVVKAPNVDPAAHYNMTCSLVYPRHRPKSNSSSEERKSNQKIAAIEGKVSGQRLKVVHTDTSRSSSPTTNKLQYRTRQSSASHMTERVKMKPPTKHTVYVPTATNDYNDIESKQQSTAAWSDRSQLKSADFQTRRRHYEGRARTATINNKSRSFVPH